MYRQIRNTTWWNKSIFGSVQQSTIGCAQNVNKTYCKASRHCHELIKHFGDIELDTKMKKRNNYVYSEIKTSIPLYWHEYQHSKIKLKDNFDYKTWIACNLIIQWNSQNRPVQVITSKGLKYMQLCTSSSQKKFKFWERRVSPRRIQRYEWVICKD